MYRFHGTVPSSGFLNLLRAFSSRNYRLLFAGQAISLIGTWMQNISMNWLVYRLTGSPLLLGASGFALDIPSFIIMPYVGVIVDRSNKRQLCWHRGPPLNLTISENPI